MVLKRKRLSGMLSIYVGFLGRFMQDCSTLFCLPLSSARLNSQLTLVGLRHNTLYNTFSDFHINPFASLDPKFPSPSFAPCPPHLIIYILRFCGVTLDSWSGVWFHPPYLVRRTRSTVRPTVANAICWVFLAFHVRLCRYPGILLKDAVKPYSHKVGFPSA